MKYRFVILLVIVLLLGFLLAVNSNAAPSSILKVSYNNVGQGDSALIQDDQSFEILIDGGQSSAGPTVVAFLRNQQVDDINVMVASHADSDHIGGLIDVLDIRDIPVLSVYYGGYPGDTQTWTNFENAVANEGLSMINAQFPQEYDWGKTKVYVLNPETGLSDPETNDASVVILIELEEVQFLFPGDIDSSIEAKVTVNLCF